MESGNSTFAAISAPPALAKNRLVLTVVASACLNLGLTGFSTWQVWRTSQNVQTTVQKSTQLQTLSSQVVYLDEVLTMSARMAASTGQATWETRYNDHVPKLDKAIQDLLKGLPKSVQAAPEQTNAANQRLIDLETQALKLVKERQLPAALEILTGGEYLEQKKIYQQGIEGTLNNIKTSVDQELSSERANLNNSIALAALSLVLLMITSGMVIVAIRRYTHEQRQAQAELASFQDELLILNDQLGQEVSSRADQQQRIIAESELLQGDVGHILEVLSNLEQGDLRVEAEVNERVTGLVSDTLNRLMESLNHTVSTVTQTAQQVTNKTTNLTAVALETAGQAQQQNQSVAEITQLIEQVNGLTSSSLAQTQQTTQALALAQVALDRGQEDMVSMTDGIDTLQQGTEQIIKRAEALNSFVELATQFSKEQKRIAALTKVLALNASLLSDRAIAEQDPQQFATIAREFATIAQQVNTLGGETNLSLGLLQQRTTQMQTVTSGLGQDITDISQLVQRFTQTVGSSRSAFDNIQTLTQQIATMGEAVSQSSHDIAQTVGDTLQAVQSIAAIANNTELKATLTRQQVEEMGQLAHTLLQLMAFFQLRPTNDMPEMTLALGTDFSPRKAQAALLN